MFLELAGIEGVQLGIFTYIDNNDKNGWVTPFSNKILEIRFDSQLKIPLLNEKLKHFYEIQNLPSSAFSQIIKVLIHYVGSGMKLLQEERIDEAFINFWIALDTVLNNDTEAKSNQLKNRAAALSWYQYKATQSDQYDYVNKLYKKRSAYIHSGKSIAREDALSLRDVSQTVLEVLLNMHTFSNKVFSIDFNEWLQNVDKVIELSYKGSEIDKKLFESTGIMPS